MSEEKSIIERLSAPLSIDDVEFRIQSISTSGYATILAYKNARTDMNRLDEVCGLDWQNKYELIDGQLFCSIGIKTEKEWIWRQDMGIESNTEKEKGRASDSFKRAGFRCGIGRELYDYPRIFLQLKGADHVGENEKPEFKVKQYNQKEIGTSDWGLKLDKWTWTITFDNTGKKPKRLVGKDQNGAIRFDSNKDFNGLPKSKTKTTPTNTGTAPKKTEKPKKKMKAEVFAVAIKSTKTNVLKESLTTYDLTKEQKSLIEARIKELLV